MVRYLAVFTALFFSLNVYSDDACLVIGNCDEPVIKPLYSCIGSSVSLVNPNTSTGINHYDCAVSAANDLMDYHQQTDLTLSNFSLVSKSFGNGFYNFVYKFHYGQVYHDGSQSSSTRNGGVSYFELIDSSATCEKDNYPHLIQDSNSDYKCKIKTCIDGYYGDPLLHMSDVCARMTPTMDYQKCGEMGINFNKMPLWPDCSSLNLPDLPDLPEPPPEPICKPYLSNGFSTTVCLVDPSDVCSSSGVCQPGCGNVTDSISGGLNFVCFGDNPDDFKKPDFDLPPDAEFDPSVDGSCRKINGTSYCPQDETQHINPDGTYPDGCGYVNDEFYCISDSVFTSPVSPNDPFNPDTLFPISDDSPVAEKLLSGIQGDLRKVGGDIGKNLSELGQGLSSGLGDLNNSTEELSKRQQDIAERQAERDAIRDGKLDSIVENLGGETDGKNYTSGVVKDGDLFSSIVGDGAKTELQTKIETAKTELSGLLDDTKSLFNFGDVNIADGGYSQNLVDLRGVNVDLGSKALETFSNDYGVQHIIWLCVVLLGIGIIFGVKS